MDPLPLPLAPAIDGDDPPPRTVATSRGPVELADAGRGPAVLALHGAMGGHDQSLILARTVGAPGLRYLAVSRPGYLGTPLALGRSPAEQADLYRDLLDALGVHRAAVLAVSGGGPSALAFAARHPDRCWAAVVVSSVCTANQPPRWAWWAFRLVARCRPLLEARRRRLRRDPDAAARPSIPEAGLRARTLADPEAGPLLRALLESTLDRTSLRIQGAENDVSVTQGDMGLTLERIAVPTLVLHGTADRIAPFAQGQAMAARIPGAELVAVEGGDHVAIFTHRAQARARVAAFLGEHAPREA